jgi:hypothetical protein
MVGRISYCILQLIFFPHFNEEDKMAIGLVGRQTGKYPPRSNNCTLDERFLASGSLLFVVDIQPIWLFKS